MKTSRCLVLVASTVLIYLVLPVPAAAQTAPIDLKFDFSAGPVKPGYTRVTPAAIYADETGYDYEPGAHVTTGDNGNTTTSDRQFMFSAKVPEGNFNVTVTFGYSATTTTTTLKAESGRLMLERVDSLRAMSLSAPLPPMSAPLNCRSCRLMPLAAKR